MQLGKAKSAGALIDAAVRGESDQGEALKLCKMCPELVTLALFAAGKRIAEQEALIAKLQRHSPGPQPSSSTPSGMVPIYTKPKPSPQRRKRPSAKAGHSGHRRTPPQRTTTYRGQLRRATDPAGCYLAGEQPVELLRARRYHTGDSDERLRDMNASWNNRSLNVRLLGPLVLQNPSFTPHPLTRT